MTSNAKHLFFLSLLISQFGLSQVTSKAKAPPLSAATSSEKKAEAKDNDQQTPKKLTPLKGKVISKQTENNNKSGSGFVIMMQTDQGTQMVDLAPEWYLKNYNLTIRENDLLQLHGWSEEIQGNRIFVAIDVDLGTGKVNLRNAWGKPLWRGQVKK